MHRLPLSKRVAFSGITAIAFILALSFVAETVLRSQHDSITEITGVLEWAVLTDWQGETYYWHQYHPLYGWTNIPRYRSGAAGPRVVSINEQGLRGRRSYAVMPEASRHRILFFGDSFTFGAEVNDDETVATYLEKQLDRAEVLNFGVDGYGLGQMMLRLETEAASFHPDHILIMLLIPNDLVRDSLAHFDHPKPVFSVSGQRLIIDNVPVPEREHQPWYLRHSFAAAWLFGRKPAIDYRPETYPALAEVSHALLQRVSTKCDALAVPCTLITITAGPGREGPPPGLVDHVRDLLSTSALPVLDIVPELRGLASEFGTRIVAPMGHYNRSGNCAIASLIGAHLVAEHALRFREPKPMCPPFPALEHDPTMQEALFNRARLAAQRGDLKLAEEAYETLLRDQPNFAVARNNLAVVLERQGRLSEAEAEYREALVAIPAYAAARNNLGALMAKLRRFAEAETELRRAVELNPEFAQAHANLAKVLEANGKSAEAKWHEEIASRLNRATSLAEPQD